MNEVERVSLQLAGQSFHPNLTSLGLNYSLGCRAYTYHFDAHHKRRAFSAYEDGLVTHSAIQGTEPPHLIGTTEPSTDDHSLFLARILTPKLGKDTALKIADTLEFTHFDADDAETSPARKIVGFTTKRAPLATTELTDFGHFDANGCLLGSTILYNDGNSFFLKAALEQEFRPIHSEIDVGPIWSEFLKTLFNAGAASLVLFASSANLHIRHERNPHLPAITILEPQRVASAETVRTQHQLPILKF